jgi:hypothetical protein
VDRIPPWNPGECKRRHLGEPCRRLKGLCIYLCIPLNLAPAWLFLYYLFIDGGTIGLNKDDIQMTRLDALIRYLKIIASAIIYRELSSRQAIFRVLSSTASS